MSTQSPFGGRAAQQFPTLPRGDVIGTYDSYPEAQRVVAKLAESDFPVGKLSIVGNDLKTVERVTGKLTYGRAAVAGAVSGLWLGLFFGIVLTLFSRQAGGLFFAAALIGAGFGMLYGLVSFAITKRQRDFTSVHQVLATNYQVICDPQLTGQAQRVLGQTGHSTPHTAWDQPRPQQPWPGPNGFDTTGHQAGSPYGSQATPHASQPGAARPGGSAPDASSASAGQTGAPRYGTNDGPRLDENGPRTPDADGSSPRRSSPESASGWASPAEPPQYGERVEGTPTTPAPGSTPEGSDGDSGSGRAPSDR